MSDTKTSPGSLVEENQRLRDEIGELRRLLEAERKVTAVLTEKVERRDAATSQDLAVFEAAARMEQIVAARTREVEEKGYALEAANVVLQDLTDNLDKIVRRRTRALVASEEQLRNRNLELQRLNVMKAEFISIAAHELRTPMTSIVGYIELMLEERYGELGDALRTRLESVQRNSRRLMRLINEMLDVARIEAGTVRLRRGTVDLSVAAAAVVDELMPLAVAKEHRIETSLAKSINVHADADKIHQVVANLIANAIRYTEEGGVIEVSVDEAPADEYPGSWARLRVRDNGIGIPTHLRSKIFEPFADFHSAKHHTSSQPDSAGLGLYVARGLIDLHEGLIAVDSAEGEYSEFTVLLPLLVASETAEQR